MTTIKTLESTVQPTKDQVTGPAVLVTGALTGNSPTDQHLIRFLGFDPEALLKELAAGKGDGEILQWVSPGKSTNKINIR